MRNAVYCGGCNWEIADMRGYHIHPNYCEKHTDTIEVVSSNLAVPTMNIKGFWFSAIIPFLLLSSNSALHLVF
jgi:hypothetical protein